MINTLTYYIFRKFFKYSSFNLILYFTFLVEILFNILLKNNVAILLMLLSIITYNNFSFHNLV